MPQVPQRKPKNLTPCPRIGKSYTTVTHRISALVKLMMFFPPRLLTSLLQILPDGNAWNRSVFDLFSYCLKADFHLVEFSERTEFYTINVSRGRA